MWSAVQARLVDASQELRREQQEKEREQKREAEVRPDFVVCFPPASATMF